MIKPFKFLTSEPIYWLTAMGDAKLVSTMSGEHIYNVITTINKGFIPNPYIGKTNIEWLNIFEQELKNRHIRMKDFKFLTNNNPLFEGMEIITVYSLTYNPLTMEPQRDVMFVDDYGIEYKITITTEHLQWNELRQRYP